MTTVADIYSAINELIPFDTKESWDNCGMLAGDPHKCVTKIITALDITNDVIEEAKQYNIPVFYIPLGDSSSDTFNQCIGVCKRLLG